MDIETLRKIQETERALRIHNINISTNEAINQVKNDVFVGGNRVPDAPAFEEIREEKTEETNQPEIQITQTTTKEVEQMDESIVEDIKKAFAEHGDLIAKQAKMIYELQGAVNEIIKEIKKRDTSVATKNPAERQSMLKAEERTQHPRSGSYKSDDVSVEKFFNYSGTR